MAIKKRYAIDHIAVIRRAQECLAPFRLPDDNRLFRDTLKTVIMAIENDDRKTVYANTDAAITMIKELLAEKNIPLTAPDDKTFVDFANGENINQQAATIATLHSLFYLNMSYYDKSHAA